MNILFLMNTTGIGGTETFTLELCNYINSMGSNVSILNMQNSYLLESSSKKYSPKRLECHEVPHEIKIILLAEVKSL